VKVIELSGTKKEYLEEKMHDLEINNNNKNIIDLYRIMN
jgi:hypothetical protein